MPKTKTVTGYKLKELKDVANRGDATKGAYDKALKTLADEVNSDPDNFTLDECMTSLKKLMEALSLRLTDWQIGPYSPSYIRFDDRTEDDNWEEPIPTIMQRLDAFLIEHGYTKDGKTAFSGICALTGVCFDDDLLEHLYTTKDVSSLARKIADICEDDLEYRTSEDGLLESPMADDRYFDAEGNDITDVLS